YSTVIDNYAFRHFTLPGITGWAQVNGYRGETQTVEAMAQRVDLDIEYMQKWSLWLDIKIIFRTAYNIVKGEENAY
ncbi:MAG: undecaprenyl-phosphate glucose phosphotransferase, partial [Microscillaceae bacterium]|nr:undecaprenyl-phosphate glucose phosphotransferase [Microscillaceae bacterium]